MADNKKVPTPKGAKRPAPPPMMKKDSANAEAQAAKKAADKKVPLAVAEALKEKEAKEALAKKVAEKAEKAAQTEEKTDKSDKKVLKPVTAKVEVAKPASKVAKNPAFIIVPVIAVIAIVAIILAVVLKDNKSKLKPEKESTTDSRLIVVTDENGIAVTDENGVPVTITPETKVVKVTDKNGEVVTDKDGNAVTTIVYKEVEVEVEVPVTDKKGEEVTDKKGNVVTTKVQSVQDPNKQSGNINFGTTAVPITDGKGQTKLDPNGEPYTTIVDVTSSPVAVEPANLLWKSSMGGTQADYISSVETLSNGNYVATNVTNSKDGNMADFKALGYKIPYTVLCEYDDKGDVKWRAAVGSKGGLTVLNDVAVAKNGDIFAVGYGQKIGNVTGKGYYDAVIYKFDRNGNEQWHQIFGTTTVDIFNSLTIADDGIIVVGSVGNNNKDAAGFGKPANKSAAVIVKYDNNGNLVWKNVVGGDGDSFKGVAATSAGIFCVGNFASGDLFKAQGKTDSGIAKFDYKGAYVGVTPIAGSGNENFSGITACKDGGIVVVGRSNSNDDGTSDSIFTGELASRGGYDAYIMKFDGDLNVIFANPFRGQNDDDLVSVVEKEDGSFIAAGCSNSSTRDLKGITTRGGDDIVIASFDKFGGLTWARSFGGTKDEKAYAVCLAKDGGYLVAGKTLSDNIDMNGIAQYVNGKSVGVIARFPE